jgi:diguanylate cyclase (GGDEF)-like protein/PAS domain S-box-containing protein
VLEAFVNILLVDDDQDDYLLTRGLLEDIEGLRFKLEWQQDFQAAFRAIQGQSHDLYLFDYHLGADSGYDLLLAAKRVGIEKPIIMLTGNRDFEADRQALQAGAADYLVKGLVTPFVLERSIRHAFERNQMLLELAKKTEEAEKLALVASRTDNAVIITDAQGFVEWVNEGFTALAGYTFEEVKGKKPGHVLQGEDTDPVTVAYMRKAIREGLPFNCEILNYSKSKKPYWLRINAQPIYDEAGKLEKYIAIESDITESKRAEEALRESEERYSLAAKGANDGLWDWDIQKDKVYYSPRWKAMLGYAEDEIKDTLNEWLARVHPEDSERVQEELESHLEGLIQSFESEHRVCHKDGTYRWMLNRAVAVRDETGKAIRMVGWQTDSSGRVAAYDALTNLPNRTLFLDRLRRTLARSKRNPEHQFAVLYIDLDGFKLVNDTLGHAAGDKLLIEATQRLESSLREFDAVARVLPEKRFQDTVARFGGDEFAVLIEDFRNIQDLIGVAERIQAKLSTPYMLDQQNAFSTASIGVALGNSSYQQPDEILRDADIAMYRAKQDGKARYALFDNEMHKQVRARFSLESDLRRALDQNEFRIHYQPIIDLNSGKLTGFEALLRWQRAEGMIGPAEFIPLSEETGIIVPLENWLLGESLKQLKLWHQVNPELTLSVNLSSRHFESLTILLHVEQALHKSEVPAHCLAFEVTEGILNQEERVKNILSRLQAMGVRIYLDDFGTGYSSLSRLHSLPIDVLKIDRSFVQGIDHSSEKATMVQAILMIAKAMQLQVIAEGIEKAEQQQSLLLLGCHYGQGYLFSRPVSVEQIDHMLANTALLKV